MRKKDGAVRRGLRCGLPEDIMTGGVRITLFGKQYVLVEGHCGVAKMSDNLIGFKSACGVIGVHGSGMKIRELSLDAAMVCGDEIASIAYEKRLV